MEKTKKEILIKIESTIIDDGKQLSVRIPSEIVNRFQINPKKDIFTWGIIQEGEETSFQGFLIKDGKKKDN